MPVTQDEIENHRRAMIRKKEARQRLLDSVVPILVGFILVGVALAAAVVCEGR